jgi:hypothetical protein
MLASAGPQQETLTPLEDLGRDLTATYGESTREVADLLLCSPGFDTDGWAAPKLSADAHAVSPPIAASIRCSHLPEASDADPDLAAA